MNEFLRFMLESGICLALFYAGYWFFLRQETFFKLNRSYLLTALLLSLLIPLFPLTSPFRTRTFITGSFDDALLTEPAARAGGFSQILPLIYFGIVVALGLRLLYRLICLFTCVRRSGIKRHRGYKLVHLDSDASPFSFFNYIFLNEADVSSRDLDRILAHEQVHINQYHSLDILLMELIAIVQWFNPFVWPYKKSLKETHEYLADHAVIAQGCSRTGYQRLIFEQHLGERMFDFTNSFKQSHIKRRMTMMTKLESKGRAKWKILLVLPAAVILLLTFAEPRVVVKSGLPGDDGISAELSSAPAVGAPSQEKEMSKTKEQEQKKKEQEKALKDKEQQMTEEDKALKKKEWLKKMKEEAMLLEEKQKKIQTLLEDEEDPAKKAELKESLVKVLQKKESLAAELEAADVEVKIVTSEANGDAAALEAKYKEGVTVLEELSSKEGEIRKKMESVEDEETRLKLKQKLADVLAQQADLKTKLKGLAEKIKAAEKKANK